MPGASSYIISSLFGLQPHAVGSANSSHSFLIPAPTEPILFNSPASAALATAAGYLSHRPPWPMASELRRPQCHSSQEPVVSRHTSSSQPRRTRQYVRTNVRTHGALRYGDMAPSAAAAVTTPFQRLVSAAGLPVAWSWCCCSTGGGFRDVVRSGQRIIRCMQVTSTSA